MVIQVVNEYTVDVDALLESYSSLWHEYKRWNGEYPEDFVLYLASEFGLSTIVSGPAEHQEVTQV
jgi:hypothetical protein